MGALVHRRDWKPLLGGLELDGLDFDGGAKRLAAVAVTLGVGA